MSFCSFSSDPQIILRFSRDKVEPGRSSRSGKSRCRSVINEHHILFRERQIKYFYAPAEEIADCTLYDVIRNKSLSLRIVDYKSVNLAV